MNNSRLRFSAILLILSMVLVACGGSSEDTVEEPAVEEAPSETLAAPATTSPPPEKLVVWAEEKVAVALDPLVGAYEQAAGVDVEVVIYDFGSIKDDVLTAGTALSQSIDLVREAGGEIVSSMVALDREEYVDSVLARDLIEKKTNSKLLSIARISKIVDFLNQTKKPKRLN